jgi:hypothetical protein
LEERRERVKENKLFFVERERWMREIIRKWGGRVVGNI